MLRNRKGQSTVEYAIVVGVVVAALVAMQTYLKRGMQARYHDGIQFLATETNITASDGSTYLGGETQYEPYYLASSYTSASDKNESESSSDRGQITRTLTNDNRTRESGGYDQYANASSPD